MSATVAAIRPVYFLKWLRKPYFPNLTNVRLGSNVRSLKADSNGEDQDLKYYADFKKFIKSQDFDYKDGHTCLHLPCKLCASSDKDKWAFVNKTTGNFICPNCDVTVSLKLAKSAYEKEKLIVDHLKEIANVYTSKCGDITQVPSNVCEHLQIKGLKTVDFEILDAGYDNVLNVIKFPLKNASGREVGEKLLYLEDGHEETVQSKRLSGILIYGQNSKQKAIVVANILDFLVLIAQRIDSRKFISQ